MRATTLIAAPAAAVVIRPEDQEPIDSLDAWTAAAAWASAADPDEQTGGRIEGSACGCSNDPTAGDLIPLLALLLLAAWRYLPPPMGRS